MSGTTTAAFRSARSAAPDTEHAIDEVLDGLGDSPGELVVFFASPAHDGPRVAAALQARHPDASVIGCTDAGEFTESGTGTLGISAAALPTEIITRAESVLADFSGGFEVGLARALMQLEVQWGWPLRQLDPSRHVGLALMDGTHGCEERVNELLGNLAPFLTFVGGSAGDDLAFSETTVLGAGQATTHGAVLTLLEVAVPFTVVKSCAFEPIGTTLRVTRADVGERIVWELDGRPAVERYAEAVGVDPDDLADAFMVSPLGLMIDGEPWIRSPQQLVEGGGIKFYCEVLEGVDMEVMHSTDLIGETERAIDGARERLGGQASGALLFNCILRRLQMDAEGTADAFTAAFGGLPVCGFHTYGESYIGHINQTLTGVVFGRSASS